MPLGPLNWLGLATNNCRKGRTEPWEFTQGQLLLEILELARLAPDKIESEASRKFTISDVLNTVHCRFSIARADGGLWNWLGPLLST